MSHLDPISEALRLLELQKQFSRHRVMDSYFPSSGPLCRELYAKHMEFFKAGAEYRERAFIAANRVGKTLAGAYETTLHLTGDYPEWWKGRRFTQPVMGWAAGDSSK